MARKCRVKVSSQAFPPQEFLPSRAGLDGERWSWVPQMSVPTHPILTTAKSYQSPPVPLQGSVRPGRLRLLPLPHARPPRPPVPTGLNWSSCLPHSSLLFSQ